MYAGIHCGELRHSSGLATRRNCSIQTCEESMKPIVLAAVLVIVASNTLQAAAQEAARPAVQEAAKRGTPLSATQPTAGSVRQAQSAKRGRTGTEIEVDEIIDQNEREIRPKLNICRGC